MGDNRTPNDEEISIVSVKPWIQALGIIAIGVLAVSDLLIPGEEISTTIYFLLAGTVIGVDPRYLIERLMGKR